MNSPALDSMLNSISQGYRPLCKFQFLCKLSDTLFKDFHSYNEPCVNILSNVDAFDWTPKLKQTWAVSGAYELLRHPSVGPALTLNDSGSSVTVPQKQLFFHQRSRWQAAVQKVLTGMIDVERQKTNKRRIECPCMISEMKDVGGARPHKGWKFSHRN